jgi:tetratricopeptide (TPR) repeat protein
VWRALTVALVAIGARAAPGGWAVARSAHFEVYAQAGGEAARSALERFEQVRALLLQQTGFETAGRPAVRVVQFASAREYEPYRLGPIADAFYIGTESRDYIIMAGNADTGAHEYAHAVLHANKAVVPPWLAEGMAELLSTARFHERGSSLGGDIPAHSQLLRRSGWMPLAELLQSAPEGNDRERASRFYAESWAVADLLVLSREYGAGFRQLLTAIAAGASSLEALQSVYRRPVGAIEADVRDRVAKREQTAVALPLVAAASRAMEIAGISEFETRELLAEVLMASGKLEQAELRYRELAREAPDAANVQAALGTIAFTQGKRDEATVLWRRAIQLGVTDAGLCYRYAALASMQGTSPDEIRPALERAIALRPDFDDARYQLGLIEKNTSHWEAALQQFQAMSHIAPERRYHYWTAMADVLTQLDRREEAVAATRHASAVAGNEEDRAYAAQLAWMAQTDVTVQMTRDAEGRQKMIAVRVPHRTVDWNPFVETGDVVRRAEGTLKEVECGAPTRLFVETAGGRLELTVPDPKRLEMRNAPEEFTCGAQASPKVSVVYAEQGAGGGILRGMEFHQE